MTGRMTEIIMTIIMIIRGKEGKVITGKEKGR